MTERLHFDFSVSCIGKPTSVFLPGESQARGSLVGCHLWGRTESDTTEATQQQQQVIEKGMFKKHKVPCEFRLHVTQTGS